MIKMTNNKMTQKHMKNHRNGSIKVNHHLFKYDYIGKRMKKKIMV